MKTFKQTYEAVKQEIADGNESTIKRIEAIAKAHVNKRGE